jgi:hypothetical protein
MSVDLFRARHQDYERTNQSAFIMCINCISVNPQMPAEIASLISLFTRRYTDVCLTIERPLLCTIILSASACVQLLDTTAVGVRREKMYRIDDHMACAVAGLTGEISPYRHPRILLSSAVPSH